MNTPDKIYLLDSGDEITWCDSPDPGNGMNPDDAIAYVKASKLTEAEEENNTLGTQAYNMEERIFQAEAKIERFGNLGNEFDRMHKQVHSRYVAERIFDVEFSTKDKP